MEGRGPWLTLVGGIDDATSRVTGATFRPAEDAAGYFAMFTCDRAPPRCARGRLLGPPRDLRPRAGPGAHPHRAAHRQAHVQTRSSRSEAGLAAPAGGRQRRVGLLLHSIRAGSPTTPPSPGAASGSPSRERATGAAVPADRSSCRSGSTAACGSATRASATGSQRRNRSLGAPLPTALPGGRGQAGSAGQPHDARVSRGFEGPTVGPCATACSGPPVSSMSPPVQTESLAAWATKSLAVDTPPHGPCEPRRMAHAAWPSGTCRTIASVDP